MYCLPISHHDAVRVCIDLIGQLLVIRGNQPFLLLHTLAVLCILGDIRIEIKDRDPEILSQILQYITAARRTAAVQKKGRSAPVCRTDSVYDFIQFLLIISDRVHIPYSLLYMLLSAISPKDPARCQSFSLWLL
jgi:hypothetical protein